MDQGVISNFKACHLRQLIYKTDGEDKYPIREIFRKTTIACR